MDHIKKSDMFQHLVQRGHHFEDLTSVQFGWEFTVTQLGPSKAESVVDLYQTRNVGYNRIRYGAAYDQRLHSRQGTLSFGLLDPNTPLTWAHDQPLHTDRLTVFPHDDVMKASSAAGFSGNGVHFAMGFMAKLAEQVYQRPLNTLIPAAGLYLPADARLIALRAELSKWQQLADFGVEARPDIVSHREESLAIAIIDALLDACPAGKGGSVTSSDRSLNRALEVIHHSDLESILASELCTYAGCSQRTLEKSFQKRFGVTPKKYIKCLRLAQVRRSLVGFDVQGGATIVELAGFHGFWHMGQFAADYRSIYGELPSESLRQR